MLLDFNLALERDVPAQRIGGTLPYMSPEQIRASVLRDSTAKVDHRSDVFSLGLILYELLCDCPAFGSLPWKPSPRSVGEHLLQQQRRGARPLIARNWQVDPALARLIERCLAFEPDRRPQTAGELAAQLQAQLGRLPRSRRWMRRHRNVVYAGVLLAASLGGAVAGYAYSRDPYWVRMYRTGLAHTDRSEYAKAVECFTASLHAQPADYDVLLARARAHKLSGDYLLALSDYRQAEGIRVSPLLTASKAYCLSKAGHFQSAIVCYETVVHEGRHDAVLLTALARCCVEENNLNKARKYLDEAIKLNSKYGPAYHLRASLCLRETPASESLLREGMNDAIAALRLGPVSGELHFDIARLCARLALNDQSSLAQAVDHLGKAQEHGMDLRQAQRDPSLQLITSDARFHNLMDRPANSSQMYAATWFTDPLHDE
jgi:tetratricopeptide (TPR) repeat protein